MSSKDINIEVDANVQSALSAMRELMVEVSGASAKIREAFKSVHSSGGAVEGAFHSAASKAKAFSSASKDSALSASKASKSFSDVTEALRETTAQFQSFSARVKESSNLISSSSTKVRVSVSQTAQTAVEKFASVTQVMSNLTVAFHGARRLVQLFAGAWAQASRFENVTVRLAPLVGGLETARRLADELRESAANGTAPFETLAASAGKLASVFKSAEAVRKWTDAFHNISAGLGRDVNELVENFVKSKASGRFEAGFLDMFAAKGVDIWAPVRAARCCRRSLARSRWR